MEFRDRVSDEDLRDVSDVLQRVFAPGEAHLWGEVVKQALRAVSLTYENWNDLKIGQGVAATAVVPLPDNGSMVFYLRSERMAPIPAARTLTHPWLPPGEQ